MPFDTDTVDVDVGGDADIILVNLLMLLFGFIGELNYIDYNTGLILGFIPFIYYFKLIYDKYIFKGISQDKLILFWYFL